MRVIASQITMTNKSLCILIVTQWFFSWYFFFICIVTSLCSPADLRFVPPIWMIAQLGIFMELCGKLRYHCGFELLAPVPGIGIYVERPYYVWAAADWSERQISDTQQREGSIWMGMEKRKKERKILPSFAMHEFVIEIRRRKKMKCGRLSLPMNSLYSDVYI